MTSNLRHDFRPAPTLTPQRTGILAPGSLVRRLDWLLLLAAAALSVGGAVLAWAATWNYPRVNGGDPHMYLKKQLLNLAIGVVLAAVAALFDYRSLRAYTPVLYGGAVLGLVAVLSPLGVTINGAHSWIEIPGFSLQPAEFAKVALIAGMAFLLSEKRDQETGPRDLDVVWSLLLAAVPLGLIMLQPDLGSALVLGCIVLGCIAISGARARWILGLLLGAVLGAFVVIKLGLLEQYQIDRFTAFLDPSKDPKGAGFNTIQARIAIGTGGIFGKGLFEGPQTNGHFVPYQWTDFIFSVAGEELGLVGAGLLIGLFALIFWRVYRIAVGAEDLFGRVVCAGVMAWFGFQAFENVGMCLGIMPVTGVPLPFVSYGGSSMFAAWLAIGLLQNIHMKREEPGLLGN
ncbi:MAG: rod shape-determining protein RodA [Actinomycetales bacterium]